MKGNGKGREVVAENTTAGGNGGEEVGSGRDVEEGRGGGPRPLVVFACRHLFHRRCLEPVTQQPRRDGEDGRPDADLLATATALEPRQPLRCPLCN